MNLRTRHAVQSAIDVRADYLELNAHGDALTPSTENLEDYQMRVYAQYVTYPEDRSGYDHLFNELWAQWKHMLAAGVTVTFHDDDPTPINPATGRISYRAMVDEFVNTGHLKVYRSNGKHPILDHETVYHNGRHETFNSIFRAVHDYFGHLASGGHFGWSGETRAYYSHAEMFTNAARQALFNETVAQQCYFAIERDFIPEDRFVTFDADDLNPPLK